MNTPDDKQPPASGVRSSALLGVNKPTASKTSHELLVEIHDMLTALKSTRLSESESESRQEKLS